MKVHKWSIRLDDLPFLVEGSVCGVDAALFANVATLNIVVLFAEFDLLHEENESWRNDSDDGGDDEHDLHGVRAV